MLLPEFYSCIIRWKQKKTNGTLECMISERSGGGWKMIKKRE